MNLEGDTIQSIAVISINVQIIHPILASSVIAVIVGQELLYSAMHTRAHRHAHFTSSHRVETSMSRMSQG